MANEIKILLVGDFVLPLNAKISTEDFYSDLLLTKLTMGKDISIVNLEAPLTESKKKIYKTGVYFKQNPENIKYLLKGCFDAVSLANNHIRDYGSQGVIDTLVNCDSYGLKTVGAGKNLQDANLPLTIFIKNKKFCILNFCEKEFNIASEDQFGANPYSTINAFYQIQKEKKENDFVIVIYHGGLEYIKYPTIQMVMEFKFMVDAGADAVIGHHNHIYSGMTYYKNKPLIYSLGNFYAETIVNNPSPDLNIGLIADITINDHNEILATLIPLKQDIAKKQIVLLGGNEKRKIEEDILQISRIIEDELSLKALWDNYFLNEENRIKAFLLSSTKLGYKIRKSNRFMNKITSKFKVMTFLNILKNDSLRNKNISILEYIYNRL